jgi:hypothetical protein
MAATASCSCRERLRTDDYEQIEVFDPSAAVAHSTVARHLIRGVS